MADKVFIGNKAVAVAKSAKYNKYAAYTRVILSNSDNLKYTAGTGNRAYWAEINSIRPSQIIANRMKSAIYQMSYQPVSITDALLDPAVELDDAITAAGIYSGVYSLEIDYGPLTTMSVEVKDIENLKSGI